MPETSTYYTISPSDDSTLAIEVLRTGLRRRKKYTLFFDNFSGEMSFAGKEFEDFKMTLTIDASSVVCHDSRLKKSKRRKVADFVRHEALTTNANPEIRFDANAIRAKALRGFVVDGVLQIREAAHAVKVNAVLSSPRKDLIQFDGDTTLRLSDFGLPRPSALFGLIETKDEVGVRLLLWATQRTEPGAL